MRCAILVIVLLSPALLLAAPRAAKKGTEPPLPKAVPTQPQPQPAQPNQPPAKVPTNQGKLKPVPERKKKPNPWGRGRYVPPGLVAPAGDVPLYVGQEEGAPVQPVEEEEVADPRHNADLSLNAPQMVRLLADPAFSMEGKRQTELEVLQGGLTSVPSLLEQLGDRTVFEEREKTGPDGKPAVERITVGQECETLLYQIITPRYRSPHEKPLPAGASPVMFSVADWRAWWVRNRTRKLEAVHADVRAAMDRYWQQGGVEQKLQ